MGWKGARTVRSESPGALCQSQSVARRPHREVPLIAASHRRVVNLMEQETDTSVFALLELVSEAREAPCGGVRVRVVAVTPKASLGNQC